ncbi:MAG: aminoglycoside phosphotransferase family protein [Phycisphaeraceae bacterium]
MADGSGSEENLETKLVAAAAGPPAESSGGMSWLPLSSEFGRRLIEQSEGRLRDLSWFRTDWQRGGALTGYAIWEEGGEALPVVVKLPVPPRERLWLKVLQGAEDVAPRLLADGDEVGGYDLAWVVMERIEHGPLGTAWGGVEFDLLIEAAARFYKAASVFETPEPEPEWDWHALLERARKKVRDIDITEAKRWKAALKSARKRVDGWAETWAQRPRNHWCHGDLHLGNAMTRSAPPGGPALLFDYARVHAGHWLRDAIYFEHLYWASPELLDGRKLCNQLVKAMRQQGVEVEEDWAEWAEAYRALTAMMVPLRLQQEGAPVYVEAALELLEKHV